MVNPGVSMDVLVYRLVQWCHGQPWGFYGCSSTQDGSVMSRIVLRIDGILMDVMVYRLDQC